MKILLFAVLLLFPFAHSKARGIKSNTPAPTQAGYTSLRGHKFSLKYQLFESRDSSGTDIDTISHRGDYIYFSASGIAYMNFKAKLDSIPFNFPTKQSVSFGDTPFTITNLGNGFYKLYQNEQTATGDYNRVTYLLSKDF